MVSPTGFEPVTLALKVRYSTNWVTKTNGLNNVTSSKAIQSLPFRLWDNFLMYTRSYYLGRKCVDVFCAKLWSHIACASFTYRLGVTLFKSNISLDRIKCYDCFLPIEHNVSAGLVTHFTIQAFIPFQDRAIYLWVVVNPVCLKNW